LSKIVKLQLKTQDQIETKNVVGPI